MPPDNNSTDMLVVDSTPLVDEEDLDAKVGLNAIIQLKSPYQPKYLLPQHL